MTLLSPWSWADDVPGCTETDLLNALAGGGLVTFTQDCTITVSAPIAISTETIIDTQGFNVSISGGNQFLVFDVQPDVTFTAVGLTIAGGHNTNGGGLYIHARGTVVLTNCTLAGNVAAGTNGVDGINGPDSATGDGGNGRLGSAGTAGFGGAAYNLGTLTLLNCTLSTNSATGGNGGNGGAGGSGKFNGGNGAPGAPGAVAVGGAVYSQGTLVLSNCTFVSNTVQAGNGGSGGTGGSGGRGINSDGLTAAGGSGATASGAAVYSTRQATIVGCTFAFNRATGGNSAAGGTLVNGNGTPGLRGGDSLGGGVYSTGGMMTNCTFYNNTVTGGAGGDGGNGNWNAGNGGNGGNATGAGLCSTGSMAVVNCTIANCSALGGTNGLAGTGTFGGANGSPGASRGGGLGNLGGSFVLRNSILATNVSGQNAFGTITDGGHNISSDATPSSLGSSSLKRTDPKIGTLANNGGPTLTMALQTNSPALDAAGTNTSTFPATDQRGVSRPQSKGADSGAFELVTVPAIITQPADQTQTNGGSVSFSVAAVGDNLKYQWQSFGTNIASAVSSVYTLGNVTITNAGGYRVIVTNRFGAVTSLVATLSLVPYITLQPTNQEISAGQSVSFYVTAYGSSVSNALDYQWYFNETDPISEATRPVFSKTNAQSTDAGDYSVVISSDYGSVTSQLATLKVDVGPQILSQPASQTVAVGASVSFSVDVTGTTPLNYQWYFNGALIGGAVGPSYGFTADKSDAGTYYVFVSNVAGSQRSASATLAVLTPAAITTQPTGQTINQGQNAVFTVVATGDALTYQWTLNGATIPGATNASYAILGAQPAQAGAYVVRVGNATGSVLSSAAMLTVMPGLVINPPVLASNSIYFSFQTATNYMYYVQYKASLSETSWSNLGNGIPGTGDMVTQSDPVGPGTRFYRILSQAR